VLHPGASAASRRYPAAQFGAAVRLLHASAPLQVFITGSAQERELAVDVSGHAGRSAQSPIHDLTGALSLGELGALIETASLLIANNSGPAHLAAALGTPVVDLYALTNPQHTPWQVPARVLFHDVACRYCMKSVCPEGHHGCLRAVTPLQVAQAAQQLLAATGRGDSFPAQRPDMPAAERMAPFSARRWNDAWRVVTGPTRSVVIRPEPKQTGPAAQPRYDNAHDAVGG
jgi:ADP-heptose:LPS heptosyltransferase